jgi:hypothetical protein
MKTKNQFHDRNSFDGWCNAGQLFRPPLIFRFEPIWMASGDWLGCFFDLGVARHKEQI